MRQIKSVDRVVLISATGQGAFIANLEKKDPKGVGIFYNGGVTQADIRRAYYDAFLQSLNDPRNADIKRRVHFTIVVSRVDKHHWQQLSNEDVKLTLVEGCDAAIVAQNLANKHGDEQVVLVNGSNKVGPGNRFYHKYSAYKAMEENIHRRLDYDSLAVGFLINQGSNEQKAQRSVMLGEWVKELKKAAKEAATQLNP